MQYESAVQFDTESRIHMGLAVARLERSVAFYFALFGQGPTKRRPGYAKFEVAEPPMNLAINEVGGPTGPNNAVAHFGIQVKSTAAVAKVADRLRAAGLEITVEDNVTCCYAAQSKVWATDPDGNKPQRARPVPPSTLPDTDQYVDITVLAAPHQYTLVHGSAACGGGIACQGGT